MWLAITFGVIGYIAIAALGTFLYSLDSFLSEISDDNILIFTMFWPLGLLWFLAIIVFGLLCEFGEVFVDMGKKVSERRKNVKNAKKAVITEAQ